MKGKTVVVTGGNSGIGRATTEALAAEGARVVIASRNREKGEEVAASVSNATRSSVEFVALDLASAASIRSAAAELLRRCPRIDVLVNNAGVVYTSRRETEDGFEATFGVNHLGHFLLTALLLDRLKASAPSRIVVVASDASRYAWRGLDFDDLMTERRYGPMKAYGRSKLANILFARELARRLEGTGVDVYAVHPGAVATRLGRDGDGGRLGDLVAPLLRPFFRSPEKGASTIVYVASSPDVAGRTGRYWANGRARKAPGKSGDDAAARRLWEVSEQLLAPLSSAP